LDKDKVEQGFDHLDQPVRFVGLDFKDLAGIGVLRRMSRKIANRPDGVDGIGELRGDVWSAYEVGNLLVQGLMHNLEFVTQQMLQEATTYRCTGFRADVENATSFGKIGPVGFWHFHRQGTRIPRKGKDDLIGPILQFPTVSIIQVVLPVPPPTDQHQEALTFWAEAFYDLIAHLPVVGWIVMDRSLVMGLKADANVAVRADHLEAERTPIDTSRGVAVLIGRMVTCRPRKNSMSEPYTIRIFALDGDPEGAKITTLMNWTGIAIAFPCTGWPRPSARQQFKRTGRSF
jgi:hypothetical protein